MNPLLLLLFPTLLLAGDPMVRDAPHWNCNKGNKEAVLERFHLGGGDTGAIQLAGDRLLVGAALWKSDDSQSIHPVPRDCAAMLCLDANSGSLVWCAEHLRIDNRVLDMGLPIESKPCIEGDRAWYCTNRGEVVCLDLQGFHDEENDGPFTEEAVKGAHDADYVWKLDLVAKFGVFHRGCGDIGSPAPSPIVAGELLFCITGEGARDAHAPQGHAPSFIALNKRSGKVVWTSDAPGDHIQYCQWSSPVVARIEGRDQVVFPGGDGWLYAFDPPTGKLLWKLDCNEPDALAWKFGTKHEWVPGKMRNAFIAPPVFANGLLYVGLGDSIESRATNAPLLAITPGHGKTLPTIRWKFQHADFGSTFGSPAIVDGIIYLSSHRTVLFALDEPTGKELWHSKFDDANATFYGGPVVADGRVIVGSDEGELVVFATGREKRCLGVFELPQPVRNEPVVRDDEIYVAGLDYLLKLRLPSK
jgi:outer membrane protein assembly factor BamB